MACSRFLNFEPVNRPSWRKLQDKNNKIPSVSEMMMQILQYKNKWNEIKQTGSENKRNFSRVQQQMYLDFLYEIQIGEDIGVMIREDFKNLCLQAVTMEENRGMKRGIEPVANYNNKRLKELSYDSYADEVVYERNGQENILQGSPQDMGDNFNAEENSSCGDLSSTDSLPNSSDAENYIVENAEANGAKTTETINLLRGYRHLRNELHKISEDERSDYLGIIDVEMCIRECHKILMKDLMHKNKTVPGKFSTLPRTAEFQGNLYFYPCHKTEDIAYDAVQAIVDQYNTMIGEISKIKLERDKLENFFKCAAVLLFGFLTLHPFSDGNGRLARLLCSHCLMVFSPFPTAIYNVFSPSTRKDYILAIVNARKQLNLASDILENPNDAVQEALLILEQKPAELCSLIIESNWFTWRYFLRKLGENIPKLSFEKKGKQYVS